jgi:hypothetical protein
LSRGLGSFERRDTLVRVPAAKTWIPIDNPIAVADAIAKFVPTP